MLFKYRGIKNAIQINDTIEATNELDAKNQIKAKGIILIDIKKSSRDILDLLFSKKKQKINVVTLASMSRDLSIYLNSSIALLSAIKLLGERYKSDKKINSFFKSVISLIDEGKSFYVALNTQEVIELPDFYLQSIKISESNGMLEGVLLELSVYLRKQDEISKQISSAMAYPVFIVAVSIAMTAFMLVSIVPKITGIFVKNGQELPGATQFVINLSDFLQNNYMAILLVLLTFVISTKFILKKYENIVYFIDKMILKIPIIGNFVEIQELSKFSYMNSILIKSGVPVVQSFKLSSNILSNKVIKKLFTVASSKVVEGEKLSIILSSSKIYKLNVSFVQAIAIGEETSKLDIILDNLANLYNQENQDKTTMLLNLLEPFLMLFVGMLIGFIVVAMLLPIFSMNIS